MPESVKVQVVLDVTQSIKSPVVGAVANRLTVLLVVATLPSIEWALEDPFASCKVPAVELSTPRVGVAVQLAAEELVALGIVPAAADEAFTPPLAIGRTPVTSAVRLT